jgi:hypothetical protein
LAAHAQLPHASSKPEKTTSLMADRCQESTSSERRDLSNGVKISP